MPEASSQSQTAPLTSLAAWVYSPLGAVLTLIALGCVMLLPGTWSLPLVDRDEPRFAQATVEMLEGGSWDVPTFNGDFRFDKPPLTYWWMSIYYHLFGVNEFSARLHAVEAALGVALLLYLLGSRMFSQSAGFWAGFVWLTTFQVLLHGRLSVADMPLMMFIVGSHWAAWERLRGEAKPFSISFWMLYACLGLGFLTKWVVAPVIVGATVLLYFAIAGRKEMTFAALWRKLQPLAGGGVVLLFVLAWGVPAWIHTDGTFWTKGFWEHVVERGSGAMNDRAWIPGYYLLTALLSLLPWITLVAVLISQTRRNWDAASAFLVSWFAGTYLVFSLAQTQLPHYVLPAFPAFALLLTRRGEIPRPQTRLEGVVFGVISLLLVWVAVAAIRSVGGPMGELTAPVGTALLGLVILGLVSVSPFRWAMPIPLLIVAFALADAGSTAENRLAGELAAEVAAEVPRERRWIASRFSEPSLVFYGNRERETIDNTERALRTLEGSQRPGVFLLREWPIESYLKWPWEADTNPPPRRDYSADVPLQIPGYERTVVTGYNLARFSWAEVVVFLPKNDFIEPDGLETGRY